MIGATEIQSAERRLSIITAGGTLPRQFTHLQIEEQALHNFVEHHHTTVHKVYPKFPKEVWPAINPLLRHFFFVGVLLGKEVDDA